VQRCNIVLLVFEVIRTVDSVTGSPALVQDLANGSRSRPVSSKNMSRNLRRKMSTSLSQYAMNSCLK